MKNVIRDVAMLLATLVLTASTILGQTPQTIENNRICMDPISGIGRGPRMNPARLSGLCIACSGSSSSAVVDGDLSNFTTLDLGVSAAGGYHLSVQDTLQYYPSGNEVGFVIRYRDGSLAGLLDATFLNNLSIRTYLNGALRETATYSSGSGLLKANVLGSIGDGKHVLSFVTSQNFDEVELVYSGAISVGKKIDVFYAFEGPGTCPKDCKDALLTTGNGATATSGQAPVGTLGSCTLGSVSGTTNLTDADSTSNYATIAATANLPCMRYVEVGSATTYPVGYEAGFAVDNGGGLLDLTVLGGVTLTTYYNGAVQDVLSGTALTTASLLDGSNRVMLGFKAQHAFNSIRISLTGVSVLVNLRVYYAYVRADTDSDGVADCLDRCSAGSDQLDLDGDGVPDKCDQNVANLSVTSSVSTNTAAIGSTVTYVVNVQRTPQFNATGVVVLDTLASGLTYVSHTETTGTTYNPTTGYWTIGSALGGTTTTVSLSITARVGVAGVIRNVAEVFRSFETDPNSTPNNGNPQEDDIASSCVSVPIQLCQGSSVALSAPANYTTGVEWFRTDGGITTSVATTNTFSASLTGSYSFTAPGATGCLAGNCCPVILQVAPSPLPTLAASQSVICVGATTTLSVSNPETGATYAWTGSPAGTSVSVQPLATTTYTVSATSAAGCSATASLTVVVNQLPVQAPIMAICGPAGSSTYGFVISPTSSGSSLQYYVKVGSAAETGPFNYGETRTLNNNSGSFAVVIRDAGSSCTTSLAVSPPTDCPTCPPKVCLPIRVARIN